MADRVTNPSGLKRDEFNAMSDDAQYLLWVMGDVPSHWYLGPPEANSCSVVTKKREPTIWRPQGYTAPKSYNYVPYDSCERTMERVEDAIREVNPELANTPRLIQSEVK